MPPTASAGWPNFCSDEFLAVISVDFNAAKHFDFDKQYGLNLLVTADTRPSMCGEFQGFDAVGDATDQ